MFPSACDFSVALPPLAPGVDIDAMAESIIAKSKFITASKKDKVVAALVDIVKAQQMGGKEPPSEAQKARDKQRDDERDLERRKEKEARRKKKEKERQLQEIEMQRQLERERTREEELAREREMEAELTAALLKRTEVPDKQADLWDLDNYVEKLYESMDDKVR